MTTALTKAATTVLLLALSTIAAYAGDARSNGNEVVLPTGESLRFDPGDPAVAHVVAHVVAGAQVRADATLRRPRLGHTATVLPHGKVLIWGGITPQGALVDAGEWFDPATSTFAATQSVALTPRSGHAASLLSDGRLLVAGGGIAAELWDYRTNSRSVIPASPLQANDAELLADGRVLLRTAPAGYTVFDPGQRAFREIGTDLAEALRSAEAAMPAQVVASLPTDGETAFAPDAPLSLRFTQPIAADAAGTATTVLVGLEGPVPIVATTAADGRLLFLLPQRELLPGSRYTLLVEGLRTRDGRDVAPLALAFRTTALSAATTARSAPPGSAAAPAADRAPADAATATNAGATTGTNAAATASVTGIDSADSPVADALAATGCSGRTIRACRSKGSREQGFWLPGLDNLGGRWRINGDKPRLADASDLAAKRLHAQTTALYGRVYRIDDKPLPGATVSIGEASAVTDATGLFVLGNIPAGRQTLLVDGSTANRGNAEYGEFVVGVDVYAGAIKPMPHLLYVPRISRGDKIRIASPTTEETVVTHPQIPGLEIRIPAGTVLRDRHGRNIGEFAIVPMPVDRAPFPVPINFPVYFMFQPAGLNVLGLDAKAARGVQIVYPNAEDAKPGSRAQFAVYDPESDWSWYGSGKVSADGRQVVPDAGVGLHQTMGASFGIDNTRPPPTENPPPLGECECDPVDLYTGLFLHRSKDLYVKDIIPISVEHVYRPGDTINRGFGPGMALNYGMYLYNPNPNVHQFDSFQLVMADGAVINYARTGGTDTVGGVFSPTGPAGPFHGSRVHFEHRDVTNSRFVVTQRDGTQYEFNGFYSSKGRLERIEDRFGNRLDFSYDADLLRSITTSNRRSVRFVYNGNNQITSAIDHTGRSVSYGYVAGRLDTVTFADLRTERYTYNPAGLMHTVVDGRNTTKTTNTYYPNGRVHTQKLADNAMYTLSYTLDGNGDATAAQIIDPRNVTRRLTFQSGTGLPLTDTRAYGTPEQQTVTYERDPVFGLVNAFTDALNRRTQITYDARANVTSITRMAGTPQAKSDTFTYTPDYGLIASHTDALSLTTIYEYERGCLVRETDAMLHVMRRTCNGAGQPLTVTDPLNHTYTFRYLGSDLRSVTDPLNRATNFTWDSLGRLVSVRGPDGNVARAEYDARDRLLRHYDAMNRLTQLGYDENGNLLTITDAKNNVTEFRYDLRNRRQRRIDALTHSDYWTFDALSNIETHTDRNNRTTTHSYDPLNRRKTTTYHDLSLATYHYDAANRLYQIDDTASSSIVRGFDDFDRLSSEQTAGGTVSYTYDLADRPATMQAGAQPLTSYVFDNANRLFTVTQGDDIVTFGYDDANRRTSKTLPNGLTSTYVYDDANQLQSIDYDILGSSLGAISYDYDALGRRIFRDSTISNTAAPQVSNTVDNTFDANNRQTGFNGFSLSYDDAGNLTHDAQPVTGGTTSYQWNARNRLVQITQGGNVTATFSYDAIGRRTGATTAGGTVSYLYDGWNPVQETRGMTIAPLLTGFGLGENFARTDTKARVYYMTDDLGSTQAVTDDKGTVFTQYTYEAYGEATWTKNGPSTSNSYDFTGQQRDPTGLMYFRARYYSPTLKRFISEDPAGFIDGPNLYAYVRGNPLSYIDPLGLAVDINLFHPSSSHYQHAQGYNAPNGEFSIGAHASSDRAEDNRIRPKRGPILRIDDLEQLIRKSSWTPGQPIILLGCNMGKDLGPGRENIAQMLANNLHVNVTAPNKYIFMGPGGAYDVYGTFDDPSQPYGLGKNYSDPGTMVTFSPAPWTNLGAYR
jgi:RHS repeat-associated protein